MRTQNKFVQTVNLNSAAQRFTLDLPRALYLLGVTCTFRGRATTTAGPATALLPEGILNLLKRFNITFVHDIFGQDSPIDMPGPTLFTYREIYTGQPGTADVSPKLSIQNGTFDFVFQIDMQFPPELIAQAQVPYYLLDAPRCSLLQLNLDWGGAGGALPWDGNTVALSAFASGSGSPTVDVEVIQVLDQANNPLTAMVRRQSREIDLSGSPFPVTADLITAVQTGESIRSVLLRQYTRDTTAGQPTSAALTLVDPVNTGVDAGITTVGMRVNTQFIRRWQSFPQLQDQNLRDYRVNAGAWPLGIGVIEFANKGNIDRVLFTQDFVTRRLQLDLAGTVVTQSNGRVELVTTSIKPNPQLGRAATKK